MCVRARSFECKYDRLCVHVHVGFTEFRRGAAYYLGSERNKDAPERVL